MKTVGMPAEMIDKVILRGSVVSIIRNPVTGTHKGISMAHARGEVLVDPLLKLMPSVDENYRGTHTIEEVLDLIGMPEPVPGNVEYLIDGKEFFTDINAEVRRAQKQIDTRVFIFDNDDIAMDFADLLKKKSKDVKCRVLLDEMGSIAAWWVAPETKGKKPPLRESSIVDYLKDGSRVKVRKSLNPWLVADHSKLIVIDGKMAYLGGMNIGREYRYEWHDMMVKVTGPAVTALSNDFNRAWNLQGGWGDWALPFHKKLKYRKQVREGEIGIRILKTAAGNRDIEKAMLAAIRMSRKRVYLQNSYFTSDALQRELMAARERGVDVRLVLPEDNDSALLKAGNQAAAKQLVESGARVYMYQPFSHIKAIVVDDWACVGSANFDALSLKINEELNISFSDKAAVNRLVRDLFLKDFRASKLLRKRDVKDWDNLVMESIADQL
ncbi:phospholipase D-like domain-containing protein [Oceaniferula spumae]